ncbi:MAG: ABC transporter permease [Oscillospiraceae bacterium]|nr:ABC transporter permease [Oscillospiraceae bacterium]
MKNSKLHGAGAVFRYSMQQHYKTTSIRIFLLVLFVLAVASFPLLSLTRGGEREVETTAITKIYIRDELGAFPLEDADIHADARFANAVIVRTGMDDKTLAETLSKEPTSAAAVIGVDQKLTGSFIIRGLYGEKGSVGSADLHTLNNVLEEALNKARMRTLNVDPASAEMLGKRAVTRVQTVKDYTEGSGQFDTGAHMIVNLFYSYFVLILAMLSMSYIFQLCMEEKVSKLVESLMVSVSPTALLVGKVLAVTCFIFIGLGIVAGGLVISYFIARQMGDVSFIREGFIKTFEFDPTALHLHLGSVLLIVVCVLTAYLICAAYSAIVGSCCSKSEDTQHASLAVVLLVLTGYMVTTFVPLMESDAATVFISLFPFTGLFAALPNYISGAITLPVLIASLVIQLITAYLLARLAGTVYRMMLLYRGGVPKPKQLVKMLREHRAAEKAAAGKEANHGNEA